MKTIIKNGVYERVSNEVGEFKVKTQGYKFTKKSEWKLNVRDAQKAVTLETVTKMIDHVSRIIEKKKPYQKPKKS